MLYRRPIGSLLLALKKPRLRAFHQALDAFDAHQELVLQRSLEQIKGSKLALAHGCQSTLTTPDLAAFPVSDYEDLRPWIEGFAAGDASALFGRDSGITPQRCLFVSTSGTTGRPKSIPVTPTSFAVQAEGWQSWGLSAFADHRDAAFWDVLPVSSPARDSMSGLATWAMQPFSFKTLYAVGDEAQRVSPFDLKLKTLLRLTVGNPNIGMLMSANPSTLLMLIQLLEVHSFDLVRDLRQGTFFAGASNISQATRRNVAAAKRLDRILMRSGRLTPADVWPRLKLVAMWLGGTLGHYCDSLRPALGHVPWRDHGLVASEGRFTVPLNDGTPDGVLDPRAAYFEFLPEEFGVILSSARDNFSKNAVRSLIRARELIPGERYRMVVTTLGGLIRYDMHDIVECRGHVGTAPVVRFLRKSSQFANITGEKLSACQVAQALGEMQSGPSVQRFAAGQGITTTPNTLQKCRFVTLAPNLAGAPPHYTLYAEPQRDTNSTPVDWNAVACDLDRSLQALNCEYRDKRASGRLGPVAIALLAPGSLEQLRARHLEGAPGATAEQFKQPVLWTDSISPLRDMAFKV